MGLIYLGILLCSIAFVIAVVFISLVLKRITNTIGSMGTTLCEVEKELQYITPKVKQTVMETGKLVNDTEDKLKSTDSLFDTIENVGTSIHSLNQAYDNSAKKLTDEQFQKKTKPFVEGMKWSEAAHFLYSKWRNDHHAAKKDNQMEVVKQTGKEG